MSVKPKKSKLNSSSPKPPKAAFPVSKANVRAEGKGKASPASGVDGKAGKLDKDKKKKKKGGFKASKNKVADVKGIY